MKYSLARILLASIIGAAAATAHAAAPYEPREYVQFRHADWTKNASIYQINTRQFTPEGTFNAATAQLPRLKELGVDILWLMPIHPVGEFKRKGALGSPYAVRDYRAVNPEFGTLADFRRFVDRAHALGMHVIIDWVGNHTSCCAPATRTGTCATATASRSRRRGTTGTTSSTSTTASRACAAT